MRMYLENGDMANALVQSQSINPDVLMEYNTCMIDEICITGSQNSDTLVYDAGRKNDLILIACQLPIFGVDAVYRARAILQLDVDDTQLSYRMLSQLLLKNNHYSIFPIPNNGNFTINKTSSVSDPKKIMIYDVSNRLISIQNWIENANSIKINLQGAEAGIYLVQVQEGDNNIENLKIILLK